VPDNVRRGRPQGKRHRKQTAKGFQPEARVKRCGKSAPRAWRHERHGKPHREQDRKGATQGFLQTLDLSSDRRPGWLLETAGDSRPRGMAITRRGFPRAVQNPAYRPAGVFADRRGGVAGRTWPSGPSPALAEPARGMGEHGVDHTCLRVEIGPHGRFIGAVPVKL